MSGGACWGGVGDHAGCTAARVLCESPVIVRLPAHLRASKHILPHPITQTRNPKPTSPRTPHTTLLAPYTNNPSIHHPTTPPHLPSSS